MSYGVAAPEEVVLITECYHLITRLFNLHGKGYRLVSQSATPKEDVVRMVGQSGCSTFNVKYKDGVDLHIKRQPHNWKGSNLGGLFWPCLPCHESIYLQTLLPASPMVYWKMQ